MRYDVNAVIPRPALVLGFAGAIPFIALATLPLAVDAALGDLLLRALLAYAATILSFLGGIHWGVAVAAAHTTGRVSGMTRRLTLSVMPALFGWIALLLPFALSLWCFVAAFLAMLAIDVQASGKGDAPPWYPRLRAPLTGIVITALVAAIVFNT